LKFNSVFDEGVDQFDLLLNGLKLFGPSGVGEWRLSLLLFLLLRVFLGLLLGVSLHGLRVLTDGVILKHFQDFAGFEVALHLAGQVLALLEVLVFNTLLTSVLDTVV